MDGFLRKLFVSVMALKPDRPSILVVDDDPDNLVLFSLRLEDAGFEVKTAESGGLAFEALESFKPDAILLDRVMPEMSGIEVAERLRSDPELSSIPVLMVTGQFTNVEILEGFHAGVLDYIAKPIDWDILVARLRTHVRLRRIQLKQSQAKERLEKELAVARKLQQRQLPKKSMLKKLPDSYGIEMAYCWRPSRHLGGDFWDLLSLADGTLGILMTDFSGVGVAPSFHTIRTKTFVHARCMTLYSPSLTLTRLNSHLLEHLEKDEIATGFYAIYNPDDRSLYYSAAGSPSPLIYNAQSRGVQAVRKRGLPLGAFPESTWSESRLDLEPGDIIMFFTDGITRIESEEKGLISERQIGRFFLEAEWTDIDDLCKKMDEHLYPFWKEGLYPDDMTMIFLRVL